MSPNIISLDFYNIVSSYIIFVTCINTLLVKFKIIYQQAFARNTHGLFHHKQLGWINCIPRIAHITLILFMLDVSDIARTVRLTFHVSLCRPLLASLSKLCSLLGAATRSSRIRQRARLVESFSLRVQLLYAYIWLLAVEANVERSARVPIRALCQRLGSRTITSGPHMHVVAPCDAVKCSTMELRAAN